MKRNIIVVGVVIVTVAAMIYSAAYKSRSQPASGLPSNSANISGDAKGKVAPAWELSTLDGKLVRLADYRGKAVLLNFWATWCGPCKIEMPWFVELQKQYGPQGLEIVGVSMEETTNDKIASFAKEMGVNYTIVRGKEAVGEAYGGVLGLPTTFFIGRDGKIVEQSTGLVSRTEIEENIKEALNTQGPSSSAVISGPPAGTIANSVKGSPSTK